MNSSYIKSRIVGVFPMKALPFHRGHLAAILKASTMCTFLYVVVSDNRKETERLCRGIQYISLETRVKWLSEELKGFDFIKVIGLDETDAPVFPDGWKEWSDMLINVVPEKFNVIFGNEESYRENHEKYFEGVIYITFDVDREEFHISGTEIRTNPLKYWEFLPGAVRPFFCKKVLIIGSESAGKTTLTKRLAKYFYTSWSEEVGRYYSERYLGGSETSFVKGDFERICWLQYERDLEAQRVANRIVFHDTDNLITGFYLEKYLNEDSQFITDFAERQDYDLILAMKPDVPWVADGLRWMSDQDLRERNHNQILNMYRTHKAHIPIIEIGGDYTERYEAALQACKDLLNADYISA